jgi:hypothetical protein
MALTFFAGSYLSGMIVSYRFKVETLNTNITFQLFCGLAIAWLAALLALALLNLTSLCVGLDNGDGINDSTLCLVYVALVSLAYTPPALAMLGIASLLANRLIHYNSTK